MPNSPSTSLGPDLPEFDEQMPAYHELPIHWVYARNEQVWKESVFDAAYFAASFAHKNPEPFVM